MHGCPPHIASCSCRVASRRVTKCRLRSARLERSGESNRYTRRSRLLHPTPRSTSSARSHPAWLRGQLPYRREMRIRASLESSARRQPEAEKRTFSHLDRLFPFSPIDATYVRPRRQRFGFDSIRLDSIRPKTNRDIRPHSFAFASSALDSFRNFVISTF